MVFFSVVNYAFGLQTVADHILYPHLYFFKENKDSSFPQMNIIHSNNYQMVDFVPKIQREEGMCVLIFCTQMIEGDL